MRIAAENDLGNDGCCDGKGCSDEGFATMIVGLYGKKEKFVEKILGVEVDGKEKGEIVGLG